MGQIRLFHVLSTPRPEKAKWGDAKPSRAAQGYTVQAVSSTNHRPCRFCGVTGRGHRPRDCETPIRRGWGWPGWENEGDADRHALVVTGSPSRKKHSRMARLAAARSKTGMKWRPSSSPIPKPFLTSGGTPAKPQ